MNGFHEDQVNGHGSAQSARALTGISRTGSVDQQSRFSNKCKSNKLMPDFYLTQAEADALIALDKFRVDDLEYQYPPLGGGITIPLFSNDKRESFLLDMSRGRIDLAKGKYQTRAIQIIILVRLDFGGASHRNPDGEEVPCPHLHVYREGFGDKWAVTAPLLQFPNPLDLWQTLEDFMRYCHIVQPPKFRRGLFS